MQTVPPLPTPAAPTAHQASRAFCVLGVAWVAAHGLGLLGPLSDATFVLLGIAAVVAATVGIRRNRPSIKWPWTLLTLALFVFLVGGATRQAFGTLGDLTANRSLVPDLIALPGYLLLGLALGGLARARRRGRTGDVDAVLDGVLAALAALTLAWVYLITPALFERHAPLPVRLMLSAYPPMSVFLVAIAARIAFSADSRRVPAFRLLLAAITSLLIGDVIYMFVDADVTNIPQRLIDVPYAMAFVLIGATLLHPTMRELTVPVPADETAPSRGRLAFVAVALGIPALVVVSRSDTGLGDRLALSAIVLALTITAIVRMFRALRAHARSEERLGYQATHDLLTGLPNRINVLEELEHSMERLDTAPGPLALLFLDLDRFKLVNDTFGHGFGDELLIAVARRLESNVRPADLVGRIGGDEFVVVLNQLRSVEEAYQVAERTRLSFGVPFEVRGSEIPASASVGVALLNAGDDPVDAEALLRDADTAMYEAKAAGRDTVVTFDPDMRDRAAQRLSIERDLRHALDRQELHIHYQPIVRMSDEHVDGFEALLRWSHPSWGTVPPLTFIPVAEETGMIVEIGAWILDESCRQLAEWRKTLPHSSELTLSVNLSARQLRDPDLVNTVERSLARHGLPGSALCLELTESLLMENPVAAAAVLDSLKDLGLRLSIDDFGTGYSSLAYLRRFPVDKVKIDKSFVDGLEHEDSSEESLVAAIIAMSDALNLSTVAEGIETEVQARRLRALGSTSGQGYLYSRPVPPAEIPETVARLGAPGARRLSAVPST